MRNVICDKKLKWILFSLLITVYLSPITISFAQTSTPQVTPEQELASESSPSSTLKDKVKALQDEIASKASQLKLEISTKLQNKAYVGVLDYIGDNSLELKNNDIKLKVQISDFTQFSGIKVTGLKSLSQNDYLAALGDIDDQGSLKAKRIIKISNFKPQNKKALMGTIESASQNTFEIKTQSDEVLNLKVKPETKYLSQNSQVNFNSLKPSQKVIVVIEDLKISSPTVRFVYLLPAGFTQSNSALPVATASSAPKN